MARTGKELGNFAGVVKGRFVWGTNPIAQLDQLKKAIQRRILIKGVRAGARIYRNALKKAPTPKETGALRRSMGMKVYRPKRKDKAIGVIGPKSSFRQADKERTAFVTITGIRSRGKNKGQYVFRKPSKYLHLVEKGFRHVGGKVVRGIGFMKSTFKSKWSKARADMFSVIGKEIDKQLAKGK